MWLCSEMMCWSVWVDLVWLLLVWCDIVWWVLQYCVVLVQFDWLEVGEVLLLDVLVVVSLFVLVVDSVVIVVLQVFVDLVFICLCYCDLQWFLLLYCMLWCIVYGECGLFINLVDLDVFCVMVLVQVVCCDSYKMKVFVCFCEVLGEDNVFIVWFELEYYIVDCVVLFFV